MREPFTIAVKYPVRIAPGEGSVEVIGSPKDLGPVLRPFPLETSVAPGTAVKKGDLIARLDLAKIEKLRPGSNPIAMKVLAKWQTEPEIRAPGEGVMWIDSDNVGGFSAVWVPPGARWIAVGEIPKMSEFLTQTVGDTGCLLIPGREDLEISAKIEKLEAGKNPRVTLSVGFPAGFFPNFHKAATAVIVVHHHPEAIVVPADAVSYHPQGWCVKVKLADGKTQLRPVKRGREHAGKIEILSGIEPGQVVIVP